MFRVAASSWLNMIQSWVAGPPNVQCNRKCKSYDFYIYRMVWLKYGEILYKLILYPSPYKDSTCMICSKITRFTCEVHAITREMHVIACDFGTSHVNFYKSIQPNEALHANVDYMKIQFRFLTKCFSKASWWICSCIKVQLSRVHKTVNQ